eukprot:TRINITY_DN6180_c0_g1_i1.p1 TRINITY_DN6180_c0_g1~~TRINITY_DN6180_c0_g1_i1.p1  ORF type:complete len:535 (+),score=258.04 TRINITY_DN6180_c0_g1_i1:50-1606(+)
MEGQKIFLTGGSGFVGRHLIERLAGKGATVHAIARSDKSEEACTKAGAAKVWRGDLANVEAMTEAAQGCDYAVHAAADIDFTSNPDELRQINVEGTSNALQACRAAGVKRVVCIGTQASFLNAKADPIVNVGEDTPLPEAPYQHAHYSVTKNAAERAALAQNKDGLEVVIVRPPMVWGEDSSFLEQFADATRKGMLKWFSGGNYKISTCHVFNVCEGIEKAMLKGAPGQGYFVTDGEPKTFRTFITDMLLAGGCDPPTATVPTPLAWGLATVLEKVQGKPVLSRQVLALIGQESTTNDKRAREELGYASETTYDEGMQRLRERHNTTPRPDWKPDVGVLSCETEGCPVVFNVVKRRHHCRACGGVFCGQCTANETDLKHLSYDTKKQRVCLPCLHKVAPEEAAQVEAKAEEARQKKEAAEAKAKEAKEAKEAAAAQAKEAKEAKAKEDEAAKEAKKEEPAAAPKEDAKEEETPAAKAEEVKEKVEEEVKEVEAEAAKVEEAKEGEAVASAETPVAKEH